MQVTIVIPVYNRAEYLLRTLQSVPADYPLIVVDNGSTDGSVALARDFCSQRPGAIFAEESESGAPAARNRGLALCQTEWVYFFDSDDEFTSLPEIPEAPENPPPPESPEFPKTPESPEYPEAPAPSAALDLICFPVRMIVDGKERTRDYRPTADAATHILTAMLSTQSMLFRTEWLRSIGGWDNRCRIWNDWELGLRALLHRPRLQWISMDEPRHRIYVHPDSITGPSYSARSEAIRGTLAVAYADARQAADERVLRALDLRTHIVCGRLRREGAPEAAASLRPLLLRSTWLGRCLELYVVLGGRGAWRMALAIL